MESEKDMIKEREVKITQSYKVCDYCGKEITDALSVLMDSKEGMPDKHFHSMHSGGQKGVIGHTCIELFESDILNEVE